MDSEPAIMAFIVVLTCIILIIFLKSKVIFKKRKFFRLLTKAAQKYNTTISQYDQWNDSAIGLNKNGTQLFIIREGETEPTSKSVLLSAFNKCSVVNDNPDEGHFKTTNLIELELTSRKGLPECINFYNIEKDSPLLSNELALAEKWCRIINNCITQRAWLHPDHRR